MSFQPRRATNLDIFISKSEPASKPLATNQCKQCPRPKSWKYLALVAVVMFAGGFYSHKVVELVPQVRPMQHPAQMLFVVSDTTTAGQGIVSLSQLVDRRANELGIERRRLSADHSDLSNVEPWLLDMFNAHVDDAPCVVFRDAQGRLDCIKIPDSVDEMLAILEKRGAK